jgi:hypothetical protein
MSPIFQINVFSMSKAIAKMRFKNARPNRTCKWVLKGTMVGLVATFFTNWFEWTFGGFKWRQILIHNLTNRISAYGSASFGRKPFGGLTVGQSGLKSDLSIIWLSFKWLGKSCVRQRFVIQMSAIKCLLANCLSAKCQSAKCLLAKRLMAKMCISQMSVGKLSVSQKNLRPQVSQPNIC